MNTVNVYLNCQCYLMCYLYCPVIHGTCNVIHLSIIFYLVRHPHCKPFESLKVLLVFGESEELWVQLLTLSGASTVRHYQADKDSSGTTITPLLLPLNTHYTM